MWLTHQNQNTMSVLHSRLMTLKQPQNLLEDSKTFVNETKIPLIPPLLVGN